MDDLKFLFDREDFKSVWLQLAADIKIRTYQKLNDIPEFDALSNELQKRIKGFANGVKFNYETFYDEGNIYSTAHVVLIIQENSNWIGMFRYNYATTLTKAVSLALGVGVCIGGVYYFCQAAPELVASVIKYISANIEKVWDGVTKSAGKMFTKDAFNAFVKWLTNNYTAWNLLIAACILKKLQGIRSS